MSALHIWSIIIIIINIQFVFTFDCYTCTDDNCSSTNDNQQIETCNDGVNSCSIVVLNRSDRQMNRIRKFCTIPGTPIDQYLTFFPGGSVCQNIQTSIDKGYKQHDTIDSPPNTHPPAPPTHQTSTLLCVCTKSLCNRGTINEVIDRVLLQNIASLAPPNGAKDRSLQDVI